MESLTYRELAQRLGVKLESARKTVQRKRWQKVTGNDGLARILVPTEALPRPMDSHQDKAAVYTRELETRIEGLHMLMAAETRRADTADRRADTAEAQSDHWRHQAELLAQRPRGLFGFLRRTG